MADETIKFESALPALLTQLLGTKTKSGGGTSTSSSTTVSNANTDPLMQIFGQQMGSSTPAGMEALLTELFTTGAQKVPVLTDAYANARGTRSTGNSALALALAELNRGLTGQAATLLGDQQAKTSQTAANIAQATRGETTTGSKTSPTTTTQTGNPKMAGGLGLAGLLLNGADKLGLLKGVKGSVGKMFEGKPDGTAVAGSSIDGWGPAQDQADLRALEGVNAGSPTYDVAGTPTFTTNADGGSSLWAGNMSFDESGSLSSGLSDLISGGVGSFDFGGFDVGGWDAATDAADLSALEEFADFGSTDVGAFDFGGWDWFADGGLVSKQRMMQQRSQKPRQQQPKGYADGGTVIRNRNNMGGPVNRGAGTGSLNYSARPERSDEFSSLQSGGSLTSGQLLSNPTLLAHIAERNRIQGFKPTDDGMGGSTDFGATSSNAQGGAIGLGLSMMGMLGLGPAGLALGALTGESSLQGQAASALAAALGEAMGWDGMSMASNAAANANGNLGTQAGWDAAAAADAAALGAMLGESSGEQGSMSAAEASASAQSDSDASLNGSVSDFSGDTSSSSESSASDDGGSFGGFSGDSDGGSFGGDSGGGDSGGGGDGGGGGEADGGHIQGPGTGTSDSIKARLSDGEFVISKDVVDAIGVDFFESLQAKFHTPAAIQNLQRSPAASRRA